MTDKTGGPAFPTENAYLVSTQQGITARDYFAANAMQTMYEKHWDMFMAETYEHPDEVVEGAAKNAYQYADAMLKAREQ